MLGGCGGWAPFTGGVGDGGAGGAGGDALRATLYAGGDALYALSMFEAVEGGLSLREVIRCVLSV